MSRPAGALDPNHLETETTDRMPLGPDHIALRDYTSTDRDACLEVFDTNVPKFFSPGEREEYQNFLDTLPGPYILLLDPSARVVACGGYGLREGGTQADFCWGMVRREFHGQGLGRAVTEVRMERIRRDPRVEQIVLHTSQHTTGFYEHLGFRTTRMQEDGYAPGLHRCDMVFVIAERD